MNLHVVLLDKFIPDFIEFMAVNINDWERKNSFWMVGDANKYVVREYENITYDETYSIISAWGRLVLSMYRADKIILHGLFWNRVIFLLAIQPWLLKKSYWIIWGGDLYRKKPVSVKDWLIERFRAPVIKRMGHLISYLDEDVRLARHWYGCNGEYHHSFFYPSNLFKPLLKLEQSSNQLCIQVGNSADPSNNHREVFELLRSMKLTNFRVICPLSYGDQSYAQMIKKLGAECFGDKFTGLMKMVPLDEYTSFLQNVDIAIFNHERQQAMGNIITLLGFGKKIYMRSNQAPFMFFQKIGVKVFDINSFDGEKLSSEDLKRNKKLIEDYFSEENLSAQLSNIFD